MIRTFNLSKEPILKIVSNCCSCIIICERHKSPSSFPFNNCVENNQSIYFTINKINERFGKNIPTFEDFCKIINEVCNKGFFLIIYFENESPDFLYKYKFPIRF